MRHTFVFDGIAVLVGPWHEPMVPPERGARVEVRLLADEPRRGSPSAAERVLIDTPLFRADLFDRMDGPPGNLVSAHFHPGFEGIEPCDRHWSDEIQRDPTGWLAAELGDLRRLVERSGLATGATAATAAMTATWLDGDAESLRHATPEIVRAVEATWAAVRSAD